MQCDIDVVLCGSYRHLRHTVIVHVRMVATGLWFTLSRACVRDRYALAHGRHLVDLSHGVGYVSGRSRVGLIGLSKLDEIIDHCLTLVDSSLVALLLQDFQYGNSTALAVSTTVQEFLKSPGATVEVSLLDESECVHNVDLGALLVRVDMPAADYFLVGVVFEVEDGSDHHHLAEGDRLLGWGFRMFERTHLGHLVGGDGFPSSDRNIAR